MVINFTLNFDGNNIIYFDLQYAQIFLRLQYFVIRL